MHPAERPDTADLVRGRATLGDFELTILSDGFYLLDGGAMFGVVPKTMWEKRAPADAQNRILLGLNTVVVRTGKHTIAIETGIGNKLHEKLRVIFDAKQQLPRAFEAAGIRPEEVDIVINSHLHFDHCGWNTTLQTDGRVTPTFPNARYFAHRGELEHGHLQLERDRVSYISENYDPLVESRQMTLLESADFAAASEGRVPICPGISVEMFPGHTAQMMAVHIEPPRAAESRPAGFASPGGAISRSPHACYIADLLPTAHHLDVTWVMGYDLDPLRCIEERKRFYARAISEDWLVLFTHDHDTPMARLALNDKGKPIVRG